MALFLVLVLLCVTGISDVVAKPTLDCAALLLLKSSITNDPIGFLTSWNKTNPNCCRGWKGVRCNKTTSRVIHLMLSNGQLSGTLHESVGSLSSLEKLDLSYNHLTGAIPSTVTKLSRLRLLDLAYNYGFQGSIPSSIGDLSSLQRIRLQSNKLTGSVPSSFGLLSSLVYAELDDNSLAGQIPNAFTRNLSNLALLDLAKNKLTGLPLNLRRLARLGILYLSSNPLTFDTIQGLSTLPFLGELHLDNCGLQGPIPPWLATLKLRDSDDFLTSMLSLSSNSISGPIPRTISSLSSVEILRLSSNKFSGAIPSSMGSMLSLKQLSLENNQLSGEIPGSLVNLDLLRWFNVSNNKLRGQIPQGGAFSTFDASCFAGNPGLCGKPLPSC